ncbi:hypothetical protein [Streptomyces sp. NPDC007346]|uniref:hypothetical protein n=1 Tax=Streptomyces sp. NPDC007346 TaxID=3154682 RepID=UPI0034524F8F
MGTPVFIDESIDADLSDLDLDIHMHLTGDAALRPAMMVTRNTCDSGATGTSCGFTNGCNPSCC